MPASELFEFASQLFPLHRSLTGSGVRQTLKIISDHIPIQIHEIPSGTSVFDWTVPKEWQINSAYLLDKNGKKIIDIKNNNLHIVQYSTPIDRVVSWKELKDHLYTIEDLPDAIPYITSYYQPNWGFCLTHHQLQSLPHEPYHAFIDSRLFSGSLTYADLVIPGKSTREVLFSTYFCHPSLANDNLSGLVVATFLAKYLLKLKHRQLTYRFVFVPETIGSLTYLSQHYFDLKTKVIAGFVLTCLGDTNTYSFMPSKTGTCLADKVALKALADLAPEYRHYSFLQRGSDERQYCSPGIDLPIASIMRSKYGEYPQYHTSKDNLQFISSKGLVQSYQIYKYCINILENNHHHYQTNCLGEPHMSKRCLYPTIGRRSLAPSTRDMMNLLMFSDGKSDLVTISNQIGLSFKQAQKIARTLVAAGLLKRQPPSN